LTAYARSLALTCFGSRNGIAGLLFALLPAGAYGLGLALQSSLAVELGLNDMQLGWLNLWSTVLAAVGCVLGGLLSDRWGRQRMLAIYVVLSSLPALWLAYQLQSMGWIMPSEKAIEGVGKSATVPIALVTCLWIAAISYNFIQGLMYGTRTALYMDLCRSEIAATQFTAYMSLMNLALTYSAWWQGQSATRWGYPITLTIDALAGCLCLVPLAMISMPRQNPTSDLR
jgi:MFS family permease